MTEQPRDPITTYVRPAGTDVLEFRVFLSRPSDCEDLCGEVIQAAAELENTFPYAGAVRLSFSNFRYFSYGAGGATQQDIIEQLQVPLAKHQIVLGFADQRIGPKTREEVLTAIQADVPRPFTLFLIARRSEGLDWRDEQGQANRAELEEFARELERVHDSVVHDFEDRHAFRQCVFDQLRRYVNRHLDTRSSKRTAVPPAPWPEDRSPYPGLASMGFDDRVRFFGRDEEIETFERALTGGSRVLFVRGPSGIGKSSLLKAGLMPRLVTRAAGDAAVIVNLGDGETAGDAIDPYLAFAKASLVSVTPARPLAGAAAGNAARLAELLRASDGGLVELLGAHGVLGGTSTRAIVCLDQAEYLITRCRPAAVQRFARAICDSIDAGTLTLLCTWRDDEDPRFFDQEEFDALRGLSNGNTYSLGRLTRRGIVRAIREPAQKAGYDIGALIDQLTDDTAAEPNSLPLLAAALYDIHQRWYARWLQAPPHARPPRVFTRDLYGGLKDVVDRAADDQLRFATDEERAALPRLFVRLIDYDMVRDRPMPVPFARRLLADDAPLASLVGRLVAAGLLLSSSAAIEFAHSRVLEYWQQLAEWIGARRADLKQLAYLSLRAEHWHQNQRRNADLLSWEEARAAQALLERLETHLPGADMRRERIAALAAESRRIRDLLEGLKMVDFDRLKDGLNMKGSLTRDECAGQWAFYKALTHYNPAAPSEMLFTDDELPLVANRGFRLAHFAAFGNNVAALRELQRDRPQLESHSAEGWTPLHMCAYRGTVQAADALVRAGCGIDPVNRNGYTPLATACARGSQGMVDFLLYCGAMPDGPPGEGQMPPLCAAAHAGLGKTVDRLLEHGANKDAADPQGFTALHAAAVKGNVELVGLLLDRKARHDLPDKHGRLALHVAAAIGHTAVVRLLLARGCNPESPVVGEGDYQGARALHVAADAGHAEVCALLLERGKHLASLTSESGTTPLHLAASRGHARVAQQLLEAGASLAARDVYGETPLADAARHGALDCIRLFHARLGSLLGEEARTGESKRSRSPKGGQTALHIAAYAGRLEACNLLLELEPGLLDSIDAVGRTPVYAAASSGQTEVLELLYGRRARLDAPTSTDMTPIHSAAALGRVTACEWLIEHGISVDAPGPHRATPLHLAFEIEDPGPRTRLELVSTLLEHEACANSVDDKRRTPLHLAASGDSFLPALRLLLAKGAEPTREDVQGRTPLATALAFDAVMCASLLRRIAPETAERASFSAWVAVSAESLQRARDAVSRLRNSGQQPHWPVQPTLGSAWHPVADTDLVAFLARLDAYQSLDGKPRTLDRRVLKGARRLSLSCYSGFDLVELSLAAPASEPPQDCVLSALWGQLAVFTYSAREMPRSLYVLDGKSTPLHRASCHVPVTMDTEDDAALFLRLFCGYLTGDDGTFVTVDSFEALSMPDERARLAWRAIEPHMTPVCCTHHDAEGFYFDATVLYATRLFKTKLRVSHSGDVEMISDEMIVSHPLPVALSQWTDDGCRIV
jgi:ankyrin repeat protein